MSRSNFPASVDSFNELFDLPFDKIQSANRLTELKGKATLTNDEQNELLQLITELKDYMITPETFNKFQDALVAVETFFNQNVNQYIEDKQAVWATYVNSFKYIGAWTSGVSYKFQNMVINENGDLFICKADNVASLENKPTNSNAYWQRASAKGEKGDTGINAIFKGAWNSGTAYALSDAVNYNGIDYIALRANTNVAPNSSSADWSLWDKLYIGTTRPIGVGAGLHFIKVINEI